jgi:integrase/recombinase XerD
LALAVVRDLREHRLPASDEELTDFETDVLAGFVLARASAGLVDSTIRNDTNHLEPDPGLVRSAVVGDAARRRPGRRTQRRTWPARTATKIQSCPPATRRREHPPDVAPLRRISCPLGLRGLDTYFGKVLREAKPSTRTGRAAAVTVYFQFLELAVSRYIQRCRGPSTPHHTTIEVMR